MREDGIKEGKVVPSGRKIRLVVSRLASFSRARFINPISERGAPSM